MTLGIIYPHDLIGVPEQDCPRLWFTDEFLTHPPTFWTVKLPPLPKDAEPMPDGWYSIGWLHWPKRTKITYAEPVHPSFGGGVRLHRIWMLTGQQSLELASWLGQWPD
jgi:hypothetical protein